MEQEPVQAAIIGRFAKGPVGAPVRVNAVQFENLYGSSTPAAWPAELQARRFFAQQGGALHVILTLNSSQQDALAAVYICPIIKSGSSIIPWGIRHLDGGNPENRYIPVQRTLDWIGTNVTRIGSISASRSNNSALWAELRTNTQSYLQELFVRGAFQGTTATQAYFVQCGLGQTMTQADVDAHVVKLMLGVALVRPSEFTIVQFTWDARNPSRPLEAPRLIMRDGYAGKQLFYSTPPGATYALKSSASLAAGSWLEHAAPVTGDGTWRQAQFEPIFGKRFFRSEQTEIP
ncbi:MAG: hypothetical protein EOP83_14140 [Verrucomicrobiaceae bacterium]|nr:MAG: hypothetical protein EOP83_14140 [Verrucomicrobiaceae bacterium]